MPASPNASPLRAALAAIAVAAALGGSPAHARTSATDTREGLAAADELVSRSLSLLGVRYRRGGSSPETGLDCSGLVQHVFREALGFVLPRRSEEMSQAGTSVSFHRLQPGDLVFFNTLRRAFSHVGIYIGENRFVHAPSSGGRVRIETIDSRYWMRRFDGARRVAHDGLEPVATGRGESPGANPIVVSATSALPESFAPAFDTGYSY